MPNRFICTLRAISTRPFPLGLAILFLAVAFYSANKDRKKGGKKGMLMSYVAFVFSFAFIVYSKFFK